MENSSSPISSMIAKRQRVIIGGSDDLALRKISHRRYEKFDRILKIVRQLRSKSRKPLSDEQAEALARRLESLSLEEAYANDPSSMERIRLILTQRHLKKISSPSSSAPAYTCCSAEFKGDDASAINKTVCKKRLELLQDMLGPQTMEEMRGIINEVRAIRSTNTSWAGILRASSSEGRENGPETKKIPKEVDTIYFRTHLIEAYAHVSSATGPLDPGRIHMYDWPALITEAKANIVAFRKLEESHKKVIARTPIACCIGGTCMT